MPTNPRDRHTDREVQSKARPKPELSEHSFHSSTTRAQRTSHSDLHSPYHPQQGLHRATIAQTTTLGQALTHARLVEHNRHQAHINATPGLNPEHGAPHTALVIAAGRGLGFDLSQPIYQRNMRGYEAMTPPERFLAEKDRAEHARLAWEANGDRRRQ